MHHILIVEDEVIISNALKRLLESHGYHATVKHSVADAIAYCESQPVELIITDIRLPGAPGTDLIERFSETPVLVMTSYASVRSAVDAMKKGAIDYISKPFDHDEMLLNVERILNQSALQRQNKALKKELGITYPVSNIIGHCSAMQGVFERINKVAPTDSSVLILGESGTGKELVARAVHDKSLRSTGPIITVNCAAIPEGLIESELFGHEKGAFTGATNATKGLVEAANGGTLFLDEIGELPLEAQARLLRLLQEGEIRRVGSTQTKKIDIRLIAATHRDLGLLIQEQQFREDLYFRLHVMEIQLPPLRERGEDVILLAKNLLEKQCKRLNRPLITFSQRALTAINGYNWPGNIRELENAIERAVILCEGNEITPEQLAIDTNTIRLNKNTMDSAVKEQASLEGYFKQFVMEHQDSLTETELAKRLGISRKSLWERRQRYEIPRPRKAKS